MKYIGNYKYWLKDEWIEEIKSTPGIQMPRDFMKFEHRYNPELSPDRDLSEEEVEHLKSGYANSVHFEMYDTLDVSFKLDIPFIENQEDYCWWLVKLMPGQVTPVHIDKDQPNITINKFWMPWTDWEEGQAFLYKDIAITKWKSGDVWKFQDPAAKHAAVNAGLNIRIALQITNFRPARGK